MNILESIIYGIISGISEFIPVSSLGHQSLMKIIFGATSPEPLRDIFVHSAMLCAVLVSCGTYLERLKREMNSNSGRRRKTRSTDRLAEQELRLIRTAAFPMLLGMLAYFAFAKFGSSLILLAVFFVMNGIILYIPEHLAHANRNAGQMSSFDALLIGLCGALSAFPGISRIGGSLSCAIAKGADQVQAYNWVLILSIPAIVLLLIFDVIGIFFTGFGVITFISFLGYLLSALFAFVSAVVGIYFMRVLTKRSGITFIAFYSWGAAFLSFLLYMFA